MVVATELLAIATITSVLLAIVIWFLQTVYRRWHRPPLIHRFSTSTPKSDDYWDTTLESPRTPREDTEDEQPQETRLSLSDKLTRRLYPYYKHD